AGWRAMFFTLALIALAQIRVAWRPPETLPGRRRRGGGPLRRYRHMLGRFRRRAFVGHAMASACGVGAMLAFIAGPSLVCGQVFGLSSVGVSAMFALNAVALLSANSLNIRLVGRSGARRLQRVAESLIALGAVAVLRCGLFLPRDVDAAMYVRAA